VEFSYAIILDGINKIKQDNPPRRSKSCLKKKADPVGIGLSEEGDDSKFLVRLGGFLQICKMGTLPILIDAEHAEKLQDFL
jgi:hypothetical protein